MCGDWTPTCRAWLSSAHAASGWAGLSFFGGISTVQIRFQDSATSVTSHFAAVRRYSRGQMMGWCAGAVQTMDDM